MRSLGADLEGLLKALSATIRGMFPAIHSSLGNISSHIISARAITWTKKSNRYDWAEYKQSGM